MKKQISRKNLVLTLAAILIGIIGIFTYVNLFRNVNENEYCKAVRRQKDISSDYSCTVGKEFQKDGKTYIEVSIKRPNEIIIDLAIFTVEKETKKVTSEAWAI